MKTTIKFPVLILCCFILFSCKKKTNGPGEDELRPSKSVLIYPNPNETCLSGKTVSIDKSSIVFSWSASANSSSYELNIKNLITGTITKVNTTGTSADVTLDRNMPYSWFVVSKKENLTTQSEIWKFYNAGLGMVNYAPFPADKLSPTFGQYLPSTSLKVTLTWEGKDVDGDLKTFDVYFGTNSNPKLLKENISESTLKDITVTANTIYYWKVISKDANNNTSDSGLYWFGIN